MSHERNEPPLGISYLAPIGSAIEWPGPNHLSSLPGTGPAWTRDMVLQEEHLPHSQSSAYQDRDARREPVGESVCVREN